MRYIVRFYNGKVTVEDVVEALNARMALSLGKEFVRFLNDEVEYNIGVTKFTVKAVTPIIPSDYY